VSAAAGVVSADAVVTGAPPVGGGVSGMVVVGTGADVPPAGATGAGAPGMVVVATVGTDGRPLTVVVVSAAVVALALGFAPPLLQAPSTSPAATATTAASRGRPRMVSRRQPGDGPRRATSAAASCGATPA
jgi:hypothetical protein